MKLRRILLIFAAAVLLCTAVCAGDYKDIADTYWASEQIAYLSDEITGYPDGTFQPDKTVTRAEFVSLLARRSLKTKPAAHGGNLRSASVRQIIF